MAANQRTSGRRRVLSGFVLLLACLTILVTTVAVWTHQVALNTDRFTSLVSNAVTEPAVTDPIATRITDQVVDALDVQGRLEARLPDAIKPLAGSLEAAVAERIDARLKIALRDPRLQDALVQTVSFTHAQLVRLLRGETENLSVVDGYLTLDAFPVVGAALTELQSMGLIPANVQLPDLTAPDAPEVLAQRLDSALGVTLPPDFGTVRLMPVARLATAQNVVRIFDLVVIVLIVLSALLVALALWLAADRRRMLIYLGIGVVIVFLLARLAMNAARNAIIGGIADGDVRGAAQTIVDSTLRDLRGVTVLIIIATVIVVIAAYLWGRPRWVMATTAYVSDTAGRAGSAAGAAASGGASGVAGRAPDRETVEQAVRENRSVIERYGLAIVVFILFWLALGLGIALLGAALVVGFELILRAVAGPSGDEATETSFERSAGDGEPSRRSRPRRMRSRARMPLRRRSSRSRSWPRRQRSDEPAPPAKARGQEATRDEGARREDVAPPRPGSEGAEASGEAAREAAAQEPAEAADHLIRRPIGGRPLRRSDPDRRLELLDPDRRRLELGRARFRVGGVDRQQVRRDVVLEVERHERQARAEATGRSGPGPRPGRGARRPGRPRPRSGRRSRHPRGSMSRLSPRRSGEV